MKYDKAYIYFDTNALECRHSGKSLFLSQFTVNGLYYEIEDLIYTMGLSNNVEICIPEIVWFEIQEHLVNHYKTEKASMESKIMSFRKSFGDLAEINCEFRDCRSNDEYKKYVVSIMQEFIDNPKVSAKIVPCPKDEITIQQIISQAIQSIKPFRNAKANGKNYTDAGFKDALIFNTILKNTGENLGIFVSNDSDFDELFIDNKLINLKLCKTVKEVQTVLFAEFNIISSSTIENLLKNDTYLVERILFECGFDKDTNFYKIVIYSYKMIDDNIEVNFIAMLNDGIEYYFKIEYNINARELISATYESED